MTTDAPPLTRERLEEIKRKLNPAMVPTQSYVGQWEDGRNLVTTLEQAVALLRCEYVGGNEYSPCDQAWDDVSQWCDACRFLHVGRWRQQWEGGEGIVTS